MVPSARRFALAPAPGLYEEPPPHGPATTAAPVQDQPPAASADARPGFPVTGKGHEYEEKMRKMSATVVVLDSRENGIATTMVFGKEPRTPESMARENDDDDAAAAAAAVVTTATAITTPTTTTTTSLVVKDPNSSHCYRHRPQAEGQRASDEAKMLSLLTELHALPASEQRSIERVWSLFGTAPARQRHLILQGIITQCCFPQLSAVSREVNQQLRIDFLAVLPVELSERILGYLDTGSLCRASQVSRWWRELADADRIWRRMCEQHIHRKCTKCGWGLPLLEKKRLGLKPPARRQASTAAAATTTAPPSTVSRSDGTEAAASRKRGNEENDGGHPGYPAKKPCAGLVAVDAPPPAKKAAAVKHRPWKDLYRDRWLVGSNWKYGRCRVQQFSGHGAAVNCLQFDGDVMATGSADRTIKIWDLKTGRELRTLTGHTRGIRALQFDDSKLISGSDDSTIKVWNWHTGECVATLQGHSRPVLTLHFYGNFLASGSEDNTVKIFDFETKRTFCLRGHVDSVNHVRIDPESRTIFSASDDLTVRIWDLDSRTCIKTLDSHVGEVKQLLLMPDDFEPDELGEAGSQGGGGEAAATTASSSPSPSPSNHGTPCLQDERTMYGELFTGDVGRPLPPRYMFTSALDNSLRIWDTATGKCLRNAYVEGVSSLVGDTLRIVTGSENSEVRVWEPGAGKCERVFTGNSVSIESLGLSDSRMASGDEDGNVLVYSFDHQEQLVGEC